MSNERRGFVERFWSNFRFPGLSADLLQRIERNDPALACFEINDWRRQNDERGQLRATGCAVLARAFKELVHHQLEPS
jgi:hypothetical protein